MSERNPNCKRELEEASITSFSPLKKTKLDDSDSSSSDSHDVVSTASSSSSSSAASASGECSVTSSAGEENDQSSSISSGCFTSESKQLVKNSSTFVVDLETNQISETETSTFIPSNFSGGFGRKETSPVSEGLGETTEMESSSATDNRRKPPEVSKTPTPTEIEDFFSKLENDDEKQKQFIEKYNFDIVNDEPLEGRYKWYRLKP